MVPWRTTFFAVNFGLCVAVVALYAAELCGALGDGSRADGAGLCLAVPAVAFGAAEWELYVRDARALERPLGALAGMAGALALFAAVCNVGEAAVSRPASGGVLFWLGFVPASVAAGAYGLWCARVRLARRPPHGPRGFDVTAPGRHHNQPLQRTGRDNTL